MTAPFPPLRTPGLADAVLPFHEAGCLGDLDVLAVDAVVQRALDAQLIDGVPGSDVLLALAFAVAAPAWGHAAVHLSGAGDLSVRTLAERWREATADRRGRDGAAQPANEAPLPWPDASGWRDAVAAWPTLTGANCPFVLDGDLLYTRRYHTYENRLAHALHAMAREAAPDAAPERYRAAVARVFAPEPGEPTDDVDLQLLSALSVLRNRLTVISGGPGTGKTWTVKNVLAVLFESQTPDVPPLRVALAAPTGKAAARMKEALVSDLDARPFEAATRARLRELVPVTLHRLLGWNPANSTRFRHDGTNPLPHDIIIVDEASMIDLPMMARLVDAIGPQSRLVLLGDRAQLPSVAAGSVLGDITDPVRGGVAALSATAHAWCVDCAGATRLGSLSVRSAADTPALQDAIVHYVRPRRFKAESGIAAIARGVVDARGPRADEILSWLHGRTTDTQSAGAPTVYPDIAIRGHGARGTVPIDDLLVDGWRAFLEHVRSPDATTEAAHLAALEAFDSLRVLAVHRRGSVGVEGLNRSVEASLRRAALLDAPREDGAYLGRPVIVTENRYDIGRFNGDVGITVRDGRGDLLVAFPTAEGGVDYLAPARMPPHQTVWAMTTHKSQGSQFSHVVFVLPEQASALLTRELVYTAITRAKARVTVVGADDVLRAGLLAQVTRVAGLPRRLWGT